MGTKWTEEGWPDSMEDWGTPGDVIAVPTDELTRVLETIHDHMQQSDAVLERERLAAQQTQREAQWAQQATTKPSNPKDILGSDRLPLHLWPSTATAYGAMALLEGMVKYGRSNWRAVGVRSSIYYDALQRHITRWFEGEDVDPDSGLPHLAKALACLAILVDAQEAGKLNDDRQLPGGYEHTLHALTPHVARLKAQHAASAAVVKHYTLADQEARDAV